MWAPSSPDLNLLEYFGLGVVESKSISIRHPHQDSLEACITEARAPFDEDTIKRAASKFRSTFEANGRHMEEKL